MRAESRDDEHAATAPSAPEARLAPASGCSVAVSVHDSTRLEWIATIPLRPARAERYRLEVLLAFPSQDFTPRTPWKRLQSSARFDVPQRAQAGPIADLHSLRLHTLEVTRLLARAAEGFRRHCVDLRLGQVDPRLDTTTTLAIWLRNAVGTLALNHDRVRAWSFAGLGSLRPCGAMDTTWRLFWRSREQRNPVVHGTPIGEGWSELWCFS